MFKDEEDAMERLVLCTVMLLVAFGAYAKGEKVEFKIQQTTYSDGVLLESNLPDFDLELIVAGPDGAQVKTRHTGSNPVFLPATTEDGSPMADGSYKYEIVPLPLISKYRAPNADEHDPALETTRHEKVSRISGSFRVVNGSVQDPIEEEFEHTASRQGVEK